MKEANPPKNITLGVVISLQNGQGKKNMKEICFELCVPTREKQIIVPQTCVQ